MKRKVKADDLPELHQALNSLSEAMDKIGITDFHKSKARMRISYDMQEGGFIDPERLVKFNYAMSQLAKTI